ncbi:Vacuolar membrane-associated protein IML1 [Serendipita indica DSM 11827]|nr:Vacuolar membrane-associated protein IML1 [Serendipita indica DSM 11827]
MQKNTLPAIKAIENILNPSATSLRMATGRRRSGTLVSQLSAQAQAQAGHFVSTITLQASTHGNASNNYPNVLLNRDRWPGIQVGDVIELRASHMAEPCVFIIDASDPVGLPYNLQVSLSNDIAACFDIRSGSEVTLTKTRVDKYTAEAVEVFFSDQYLGRGDMWRLSSSLAGKCWHKEQKINFVGCISATIKTIFLHKKEAKSAYVSPETKIIYRSLTAKCTIFIQLCREIWDFADDGERYYEKVVHSFLPALFRRWKMLSTRHVITIVLISRVFYDSSEIEYAAGPIQRDDDGRAYKDFFKVVTDIEVIKDWKPTLNAMKESLIAFQRDILLTHHYHQHNDGTDKPPRLIGQISYAHDGPILEAINLGLNPTEAHYIDRSLSLTGTSTILITPGKGHFRVSKKLLKLTTTRLLDQGFGLDVIALGKAPLHATPLFSFISVDPSKYGKEGGSDQIADRVDDVLWGGPMEDPPLGMPGHVDGRKVFYWQPFWIFLMFWDIQMDLPFREDQYIPRARMPQFELMGLLHYDLISSIAIPALDTSASDLRTSEAQDHFDQDVFSSGPTSVSSPTTTDPSSLPRGSIIKQSGIPSSLGVSVAKQHIIRRTPSTTSLNNSARPGKLNRTDSIEDDYMPRRSRPNSSQFDDATRERLAAALTGTSPKTGRLGQIQAQAERRARSTSQNLTMTEASSSNLIRKPSASTRGKSPPGSRRNSTAQLPPKARKEAPTESIASVPLQPESSTKEVSASRKTSDAADKKSAGLQFPFARLTSSWLLTPWRLNAPPAKESTVPILPSMQPQEVEVKKALPEPMSLTKPVTTQPLAIKDKRQNRMRTVEDVNMAPGQRLSANKGSPASTSPAETPVLGTSFRNSTGSGLGQQQLINPSATEVPVLKTQTALARRWEHIYTLPTMENEMKWKSIESPGCLPLTTGYFPTKEELEKAYRMHFYDVTLGLEMSESFLVKRPVHDGPIPEDKWALAIMRVMVGLRLAQGFQFVLLSEERARELGGFGRISPPRGPSEILNDVEAPVYLSMSDQIHRLQYDPTGPSIRVERFVRKSATVPPPIPYACLIWPKRGGGYTECATHFKSPEMEMYGWNRLDMLAFGYEQQFSESLRYWRTRFIVIPTEEKPQQRGAPRGAKPLSDEELRLVGMEKLADHFTRARWLKSGETLDSYPPVKFLPTTLDPVPSVLDDGLMAKLEELHEAGALRKRANNSRTLEATDLMALANMMRQPGGLPIRDNRWHTAFYPDSFTGEELVSWFLREFNDVSTREQGTEWGVKLEQMKFLKHCRDYHGFIDGHYYYKLLPPFQNAGAMRPALPYKFTTRILRNAEERSTSVPGGGSSGSPVAARRDDSPRSAPSKRRILSSSMIVDMDPHKTSTQSETAILHYDLIQNPGTAFHFQLHWVGTSAKFIDEMVKTWSRAIDWYGLRLVEAYVDQITDITKTNVFQSCFPIDFAVPPPALPPNSGMQPDYFEGQLLRNFNYVLDISSSQHYANRVNVYYSYRNSEFNFSQYVHKSGLAFVQVIEGKGFSWLTNRLATTRQHSSDHDGRGRDNQDSQERPNRIMDELNSFCTNKELLQGFWDEELHTLMRRLEAVGTA